jgi:membrane protein implicated in regulation of membrane protease activity
MPALLPHALAAGAAAALAARVLAVLAVPGVLAMLSLVLPVLAVVGRRLRGRLGRRLGGRGRGDDEREGAHDDLHVMIS